MDCCHSATVLDLPYQFIADGESEEMMENDRYSSDKFEGFLGMAAGIAMGIMSGDNLAEVAVSQCCTVQ